MKVVCKRKFRTFYLLGLFVLACAYIGWQGGLVVFLACVDVELA